MSVYSYTILLYLGFSGVVDAVFDVYHANKAYKMRDYDKAYEHFSRDVATNTKDGNDGSSLYNMGVVAYQKKDYETARDCFSKAADISSLSNTQQSQLHFNLGKTYEKLQRYRDAEEQFDKSLSYDPDNELAKKAKEHAEQERKKQEDLANKPSKETKDQDQRKSDTHNQEQQNQGESDQSSDGEKNEKDSTKPDAHEQRDNESQRGEEYADSGKHGSGQQSYEQSSLNDMCHNDTNTLKENNSTPEHTSMNSGAEQKALLDEKLTKIDKKVLAVVGEIDNKLQKELMKIALKQQSVRRGQKNW